MTDDLIETLKSVEQGSRELSDRCLLALGWQQKTAPGPDGREYTFWRKEDNQTWYADRPDPTQSVDNALSLLPGRYVFKELIGPWKATICGFVVHILQERGNERIEWSGIAKTPALAICVALITTLRDCNVKL